MRVSTRTRLAVSAAAVAALGLAGGMAVASPAHAAATCALRVDRPVRSPLTVYPPIVVGTAGITCSAPVTRLDLTLVIYRNGTPVATASGSNVRNSSIAVTANGTCVSGVHQARAVGRVQHSDTSAPQILTGASPSVPLAC